MDWIPKITDLAKVPTKVFAVIALTTGAALFLPTSMLKRLSMDIIPAPWGVVVGIVFLISAAMVVVNCVSWFVGRRRSIQRTEARNLEMVAKLGNLDAEERAILREFIVFRRSSLGLPVDNPTVAGLRASGVIRLVGTVGKGSRFGVFFPFQLSREADAIISDEILGVSSQHLQRDGDGTQRLTGEGHHWLTHNRPAFAEGIDKFDGADHRSRR